MRDRIKRFASVFAVLSALGGCAVYPAGGPAYGGGYYGYGAEPVAVQPEVLIGVGGGYGSRYYDQRRGYGPGYRGQSNPDGHARPDHGDHYRSSDGGPHGAAQQGGAPAGSGRGGPPPQISSNGERGGSGGSSGGGQRGSGSGGGGNNRPEGYGYGQHSNSH
jgi:hypothetical protein